MILIENYLFPTDIGFLRAPAYYTSSMCGHCGTTVEKTYISISILQNNNVVVKSVPSGGGTFVRCLNPNCEMARMYSYILTALQDTKNSKFLQNSADKLFLGRYITADILRKDIRINDDKLMRAVFFCDRDQNASINFARYIKGQSSVYRELLILARSIAKYIPNSGPISKESVEAVQKSLKISYEMMFGYTLDLNTPVASLETPIFTIHSNLARKPSILELKDKNPKSKVYAKNAFDRMFDHLRKSGAPNDLIAGINTKRVYLMKKLIEWMKTLNPPPVILLSEAVPSKKKEKKDNEKKSEPSKDVLNDINADNLPKDMMEIRESPELIFTKLYLASGPPDKKKGVKKSD